MSKTVVVRSSSRLACCGQDSPDVVMCLDSDTLLASGKTTLEGTLTSCFKNCSPCGEITNWSFCVSYDNTLLTDPDSALTTDDVTGIFCKGCLTTWVEELIVSDICVTDSDTIDFTIGDDGCISGRALGIDALVSTPADIAIDGTSIADFVTGEFTLKSYLTNVAVIQTDSLITADSRKLVLSSYRRAGGAGDATRGAVLELDGINATNTGDAIVVVGGTSGRFRVIGNNGNTNILVVNGTSAGGATLEGALSLNGDVTLSAAGKTVNLKTGGANATSGTFVANGASNVLIVTTAITPKSIVVFGLNTAGGTVGATPKVTGVANGTQFTVAASALDTSTYNWAIIQTV